MEEKEMEEMFCFQCQQTAHNTGCEGHTVYVGKSRIQQIFKMN